MSKDTVLAIVVPCFNEKDLITSTTERLLEVLSDLEKKEKISDKSYLYFVDDGSIDNTWYEIYGRRSRRKSRI